MNNSSHTCNGRSEWGNNLGKLGLAAGVVLRLGADLDVGGLVDNLLHGVLDELVEGVELLAHEALLLEVGGDDGPGVVLRDLLLLLAVPVRLLVHLVPVPAPAAVPHLVVVLRAVPPVAAAVRVVSAVAHLHPLLVLVILHGQNPSPSGGLLRWGRGWGSMSRRAASPES